MKTTAKTKVMQGELFKADTSWFHIFKELIRSGTWAKMSPAACRLYPVIKAFTNWSDGSAFPSFSTLEEYSGLARTSITRAIKELEELGFIRAEKSKGRSTMYRLVEQIHVDGADGRPAAVATFDYIPGMVKEAVAELKNVLVKGELADGKHIHIETLNLTVNIAGHNNIAGNQTIVDVDGLEELRRIRAMLDRGHVKEASARVHELTDKADGEEG